MAARTICKPFCFDMDEIVSWNLPGSRQIASSSFTCINFASYGEIYLELVLEFWGGADFDREIGFSSEVVDYALSFDMHTLAQLLRARSSGAKFEKGWRCELDNADICQTLYGRQSISDQDATKVHYLTPAANLVHILTVNVFCPRLTQHHYIRELDCFIIYHVLKNRELDPMDLVYGHFKRMRANTNHDIPYGFIITRLLMDMGPKPFLGWSQIRREDPELMTIDYLERRGISIIDAPWLLDTDRESRSSSDSSSDHSGISTSLDAIVDLNYRKRKRDGPGSTSSAL